MALLILATVGAIVAVTLWNARSTHRRVAQTRIEHATQAAAEQFEGRIAPVEQGLTMTWEWGKMGLISATDADAVVKELTPVLRPLDRVAASIVANDRGEEVRLYANRAQDGTLLGWTTRTRRPTGPEAEYIRTQWSADGKRLESAPVTMQNYDPSTRPWFTGALSTPPNGNSIFRSPPHALAERDAYGVSQSMRFEDRNGDTTVVAFDMLLTGLSQMVNEINVSEHGVAFLCNAAGEVFLPSSATPAEELPPIFVAPEKVGNPLVAGAMQAWLGDGTDDEKPVHFGGGRGAGWAGFKLLDARTQLWIGVAVPDADIFGTPLEGPAQLIVLLGGILLAGILLTVFAVRRYGAELREEAARRVDDATFGDDVRALIDQGEGARLEFKSTVRRNLKTGKNSKDIELAWLKGAVAFMNSDGGTVLIGVADDGTIRGVEEDDFGSDDRCRLHLKNLVNQHIGAEFSQLIRFKVQAIQGKTIVVVECERTTKPVFLQWNNRDAFYIRSGPSSVELSSRQVLEYVDQRS
ncbi:MAG: RNA-binding domain-containing protein [Myxococcota bacterium]